MSWRHGFRPACRVASALPRASSACSRRIWPCMFGTLLLVCVALSHPEDLLCRELQSRMLELHKVITLPSWASIMPLAGHLPSAAAALPTRYTYILTICHPCKLLSDAGVEALQHAERLFVIMPIVTPH